MNEKLKQTRFNQPGFVLFKECQFVFKRQFWATADAINDCILCINLSRFIFALTFFTDLALTSPNQAIEALIKDICNEHLQRDYVW